MLTLCRSCLLRSRIDLLSVPRRYLQLRDRFLLPDKEKLNYFPGHMRTALYQLEARLRSVDAVIEVHDARVPFSGRNPRFSHQLFSTRAHLLVMNKADLIPRRSLQSIEERLRQYGDQHVVFTCCLDQTDSGLRAVTRTLVDLVRRKRKALAGGNPLHSSMLVHRQNQHHCMVVGVPNVGKSSLINALRALHMSRSRATAVGAVAGVTRSVLTRISVCQRPPVFVLDTPGVLLPQSAGSEAMLRLALCAALQDHLVGPELLADYLLYWMNRRQLHQYVDYMGLQEPTDDIQHLLWHSAIAQGRMSRRQDVSRGGAITEFPDMYSTAVHMIRGFRSGQFGRLLLDDVLSEPPPPR